MITEVIEKMKQDKVIDLMCQILELEETSEETVKKVIEERGLRIFFATVEELDFEMEELQRIKALEEIIHAKEQEIMKQEGAITDAN